MAGPGHRPTTPRSSRLQERKEGTPQRENRRRGHHQETGGWELSRKKLQGSRTMTVCRAGQTAGPGPSLPSRLEPGYLEDGRVLKSPEKAASRQHSLQLTSRFFSKGRSKRHTSTGRFKRRNGTAWGSRQGRETLPHQLQGKRVFWKVLGSPRALVGGAAAP